MAVKGQQKRAELFARGISLRAYCKEKGISYQCARDLLIGRNVGSRGKGHEAAVVLGLKPDPATLKFTY